LFNDRGFKASVIAVLAAPWNSDLLNAMADSKFLWCEIGIVNIVAGHRTEHCADLRHSRELSEPAVARVGRFQLM
jgi:hypothetical protein